MIITPAMPLKRYGAVIIDPPWPVQHNQTEIPYNTMLMSEIAGLPIRSILAEDAYLLLWTTNSMMEEAFGLLRLWRLRFVQTITWCKNYGLGRPPYTATEHALMARVGNPRRPHQQKGDERIFNWFSTDHKPKHSVKPDNLHEMAEKLMDGPYLEMFGRRPRDRWDVWGLEAPNPEHIIGNPPFDSQSTEKQLP